MIDEQLVETVVKQVIDRIHYIQQFRIPVGVSNRHIHLSQSDFKTLFGSEAKLIPFKKLKQPGQFAAEQTLKIKGPKGQIENVRILGPFREKSQIEVSMSDTFQLGVKPTIRESGDLEQTPGIELMGPKGSLCLQNGVIVASRHIHMAANDARKLCLEDKDKISIETFGERKCILGNVLVRVSENFVTEIHLDLDEANACALKNQDYVGIYHNH